MRGLMLPALVALLLPLSAQEAPGAKPDAKPKAESSAKDETAPLPKPVITHHQITAGGKVLKYTATVGFMPLKDAKGDTEARIFYTAYTLDGGGASRPLIFAFNGGPGSASIWLHLGCIGPRRVQLQPDGELPPPPFHLVDNADTWLDQHRPRLHRSRGNGIQPGGKARRLPEFLEPQAGRGLGGRVHPPLPHPQRALDLAPLPGRRELRHHARLRRSPAIWWTAASP